MDAFEEGGRDDLVEKEAAELAELRARNEEEFELLNEGGDIHILNLSNRMPTLLAGRPLDDKTRLHSDALVGTGETILRIVF